MLTRRSALLLAALLPAAWAAGPPGATFTVAGEWSIRVSAPGRAAATLAVTPPVLLTVTAERYDSIPMYNPKAGGWARGAQLRGVHAQETTNAGLLDRASFVLRAGPEATAPVLEPGRDYQIDLEWGTFGRIEGSRIAADQPVYASYRHAQVRLDAVVATAAGIELRQGTPRAAAPAAPVAAPGEQLLGYVYLPGTIPQLTADHLFPILETAYPEPPAGPRHPVIERLAARLEKGETVRLLAWGDSVTDGAYLPDRDHERWQEQFAARLRAHYPKARIEMLTQAWGGRNTKSYLNEPPGSPHNYQETVLALKPDVIISEFVNDAGLKPAEVEERYARLLGDFEKIGADWIILTPHYVRPDWMQLTRERDIDDDPRPYVRGLREFCARHPQVALADASLRYGRLWRQGIPYNTLMVNAINHPDVRGMRLFADALMALFQ